MRSDITRLKDSQFDVIILGAGVQGMFLALEAISRGLKTLMIDESDFCAATSANSLKILHGGFRYLQHGHLGRYGRSARESALLSRLAPFCIDEMAFSFPLMKRGLRSRPFVGSALWVHQKLLHMMNAGFKGKAGIIELSNDAIPTSGSGEFAVFYDRFITHTETYFTSLLLTAKEMGVEVFNYTTVTSLQTCEGRINQIDLRDSVYHSQATVSGKVILTALGAGTNAFYRKHFNFSMEAMNHPLCVYNLVVKKKLTQNDRAHILFSPPDGEYPKGRGFVFIPWKNGTLIGSYEKSEEVLPRSAETHRFNIQSFIRRLNHDFSLEIDSPDVAGFHMGYVPANPWHKHNSKALDEPVIKNLRSSLGIENCYCVIPEKLTMARYVAVLVLNRIFNEHRLGNRRKPHKLYYSLKCPRADISPENVESYVELKVIDELAVYPEDIWTRRTSADHLEPVSPAFWSRTEKALARYFPNNPIQEESYAEYLKTFNTLQERDC